MRNCPSTNSLSVLATLPTDATNRRYQPTLPADQPVRPTQPTKPARTMKYSITKNLILAFALCIASGSAATVFAQKPDAPPPPLRDSDVKGFAQAMIDLSTWSHENADRWEKASEEWAGKDLTAENMKDFTAAFSAMWGESGEIAREAEKIVKRHGFDSLEQWSIISSRVMSVYAAIEVEKVHAASGDGVAKMLDGLAASGLSAEQQAEMKKALADAKKAMDDYQSEISPIDRAVVQRNIELLHKTMEELRAM